MDILFRSPDLEVRRVAVGAMPARVVTFDCYHDELGFTRPAFGEGFFEAEGISAIHVLTAGNDWFQYPELPDALAAIRIAVDATGPVLAYGSSMGGYAAVRFADAAGAHVALALSPQYSVDPRKTPFETRWTQDRRRIRFLPALDGPIATRARIVAAYDPMLAEDRHHIDRIAADAPTVRLALPHAGHPAGAFLSDIGLLRPLVQALVTGDCDADSFAQAARLRRKGSPTWLSELAGHQPPHRAATAIALAEQAAARAPDSPAVLDRLALRLRDAGLFDRAIAVHRRAVALAPLPNYLWGLGKTLAAAGDRDDALDTAMRLQQLAPAVAGYHRWAADLRLLRGDRHGAIADLERAVAAAPDHHGYRWTLRRERLLWLLRRA